MIYVLIGVIQDGGNSRNDRRITLQQLGSATSTRTAGVTSAGTSLVIASSTSRSSAAWNISSYEISHLAHNSQSCNLRIWILNAAISALNRNAFAEILFDGHVVKRVSFSSTERGLYATAPGRYLPSTFAPKQIDIVPLDRPFGFVVPLAASACRANVFNVSVVTSGVDWKIAEIGLLVNYVPARSPIFNSKLLTVIAATVLVIILLGLVLYVLLCFSSLGICPLIAATAVLVLSPLAYDQWDFSLWIRFSEIATFGGANPAQIWAGSPLWALVPQLFSTITLASYLVTGDGSQALTELLLKVGIGLAYCFNAYIVAVAAPTKLRCFLALSVLLVPAGLYEVAAGYREPFAISFALIGLLLSRRAQFTVATFVLCAAASISETLLPLVMFPAALALSSEKITAKRALRSAALAVFGMLIFVTEWLCLVPRDAASDSLAYRFGEAPPGGASWVGALTGLHILPSWLPAHSLIFGAAVFCVFAFFPCLRLRAMLLENRLSSSQRYSEMLGLFLTLLAAFFLAFRGVDPNTWYTIILMTFYYFALEHPSSPFPLIFGTVLAFAVYAAVGFGDFLDHTSLWPFDRGLLGILGVSRYVFDLMQAGLATCLITAIVMRNTKLLFSPSSLWFFTFFTASVATTAIRFYVLDFVLLSAGWLLIALTLKRQLESQRRRYRTLHLPVTISRPTVSYAIRALRTFRIGLCDIVFVMGAFGVMTIQKGVGTTSIVGWIVILGSIIFAFSKAYNAYCLLRS